MFISTILKYISTFLIVATSLVHICAATASAQDQSVADEEAVEQLDVIIQQLKGDPNLTLHSVYIGQYDHFQRIGIQNLGCGTTKESIVPKLCGNGSGHAIKQTASLKGNSCGYTFYVVACQKNQP